MPATHGGFGKATPTSPACTEEASGIAGRFSCTYLRWDRRVNNCLRLYSSTGQKCPQHPGHFFGLLHQPGQEGIRACVLIRVRTRLEINPSLANDGFMIRQQVRQHLAGWRVLSGVLGESGVLNKFCQGPRHYSIQSG
jgi:hypothetical protein